MTNPLWVIKARIMTDSTRNASEAGVIFSVRKLFHDAGFLGFFKGLGVSIVALPEFTLQVWTYDKLQDHLRAYHNKNQLDCVVASATSKVCATAVFYPLHVVRTQLQTSAMHTAESPIRLLVDSVRCRGFSTLYSGMGVSLLRSLPATCVTFVTYEAMLVH